MKFLKVIALILFINSIASAEVENKMPQELIEKSYIKIVYQKNPQECLQQIGTSRRAAFDFGGGSIRVLVADVDPITKNIEKLFSAAFPINFRLDLINTDLNAFSEKIQESAIQGMQALLEATSNYFPEKYYATATESFRIANNGLQLLEKITAATRVPIEIIDQKREGELGFLSAVSYAEKAYENALVVDLGTGSVQISALNAEGHLMTHGLKLGSIVLRNIITKQIRNLETTTKDINPVTIEEAKFMIDKLQKSFDTLPEELITKLKEPQINVIMTCGISNTPVLYGSTGWEYLKSSILDRKTGDGINEACAVKACFCYAFINQFNIDKCLLVNSNKEGNTFGMLTTEKFWE